MVLVHWSLSVRFLSERLVRAVLVCIASILVMCTECQGCDSFLSCWSSSSNLLCCLLHVAPVPHSEFDMVNQKLHILPFIPFCHVCHLASLYVPETVSLGKTRVIVTLLWCSGNTCAVL